MAGIGQALRAMLGALAVLVAGMASAQDSAGLARVNPEGSRVEDDGRWLSVALALSQPVPWRVYTLDAPPRLVVDFREVDWRGVTPEGLLEPGHATALRFGEAGSGWSRLVVGLAGPFEVAEAGMAVEEGSGAARLLLSLAPTDAARFAELSGAPPGMGWAPPLEEPAAPVPDGRFVVAIDPGHGGIDPGAERAGLREAHLMLALGRELAEAVARAGMVPVLTREDDSFVPLQERMTLARAAGADVLLSLHADALEEDEASGASIYTLSQDAVDQASERMVERHDAGDLLAGLDLSGQDDTVAKALMDLARLDAVPRSRRLAETLARELGEAGAAVNNRALREAPLAVLNAADFPSVLVEVGFLSHEDDRARLATPEGRAAVVAGIVAALEDWRHEEAARAPLVLR